MLISTLPTAHCLMPTTARFPMPTFNCQLFTAHCPLLYCPQASSPHPLPTFYWSVVTVHSLLNAHCLLPTVYCILTTLYCPCSMTIVKYPLSTACSLLRIWLLFTAHHPLSIAHCPLFTVVCLLPTVYCLLFTAHCHLFTAHCHCLMSIALCVLPTVY